MFGQGSRSLRKIQLVQDNPFYWNSYISLDFTKSISVLKSIVKKGKLENNGMRVKRILPTGEYFVKVLCPEVSNTLWSIQLCRTKVVPSR